MDTRKVFAESPVHVRLFYRIGRSAERFVDYLYNPLSNVLRPLFPLTADMGLIASVFNDGADIFSASGRLCRRRERGGHEACLQAGLMKVMTLPSSVASCAEVSVTDALEKLGGGEGTFTRRGYGRDGSDFPNANNQGRCMTGDACRIWDGTAKAGDTGDGGNPVAAEALAIPQAVGVVTHRFRRFETFLNGASEVLFDGVGDEDGLCESGEA